MACCVTRQAVAAQSKRNGKFKFIWERQYDYESDYYKPDMLIIKL